ncbi:hypothetical protein QFC24_005128 [Naganishia onofrii]|uniref:Uncharacterized protein n=1 Tax=Naganishia onofrii TaxID=1851511 RepID=A0ACC2XA14_9TREE|nr:hypothetical protein QFC24_005128 [Naganishia onofrii]
MSVFGSCNGLQVPSFANSYKPDSWNRNSFGNDSDMCTVPGSTMGGPPPPSCSISHLAPTTYFGNFANDGTASHRSSRVPLQEHVRVRASNPDFIASRRLPPPVPLATAPASFVPEIGKDGDTHSSNHGSLVCRPSQPVSIPQSVAEGSMQSGHLQTPPGPSLPSIYDVPRPSHCGLPEAPINQTPCRAHHPVDDFADRSGALLDGVKMPPPEPPHGYQVEGRNPYAEQQYYRQAKGLHKRHDALLDKQSQLKLTTDRVQAHFPDWKWVDEQNKVLQEIHDLEVILRRMEATYPGWHFADECSWRAWEANDENWHQLAFYKR